MEELEKKHNIDDFLAHKKIKYNPKKSIFCHRLDSITSIKNLVEEWDVRKFSLPKIDKTGNDDSQSIASNFNDNQRSKTNVFAHTLIEEENIIKFELDKKLVNYLPAK